MYSAVCTGGVYIMIYGAVHVLLARFTLTSMCHMTSVGGHIHPYNNNCLHRYIQPVQDLVGALNSLSRGK